MAGLVEEFCLQLLPKTSYDFLFALSEEYKITLDDAKKDEKAHVLKMVMRYLTGETLEGTGDGGAAVFLKLYKELGEELKKEKVKLEPVETPQPEPTMPALEGDVDDVKGPEVEPKADQNVGPKVDQKVEVKVESKSVGKSVETSEKSDSISEISYHKLRQFKINGTIGDPGQKTCVTYSSLCYQISQGEKQGYSLREIYGGVIRAIEAGNPFRDVLELEAEDFDNDREAFMKSLRSHFREKDPNEVKNELRICVQNSGEDAHKFFCRCVALKKKVQKTCRNEGLPCDEADLSATFFKTLYTGLRQNNIRNEMRAVLREGRISDQDLLVEVALAASNEEERLRKLNGGKSVNVNKLTLDSGSDSDDSQAPSSGSGQDSGNRGGNSSREQSKGQKKGNPQPQQNNKTANKNNNTSASDGMLSSADVNKMVAAFEKVTESNKKLTADVLELKKMADNRPRSTAPRFQNPTNQVTAPTHGQNTGNGVAGQQQPAQNNNLSPFAPTYPTAPPLPPPQYNNQKEIYRCPNCVVTNSRWCRHCFYCGSSAHQIKDCPENP